MKTIQFSLQVADDITSINQLERYVNHLGQQIKRQLFTNMLAQLAQSESQSDSSPSTCPNCQKTETMAWGNRPRVLKTVFGPVHFRQPGRGGNMSNTTKNAMMVGANAPFAPFRPLHCFHCLQLWFIAPAFPLLPHSSCPLPFILPH